LKFLILLNSFQHAYSCCPHYEALIPHFIENGIDGLQLDPIIGTPILPTLGTPMRSIFDVITKAKGKAIQVF
jgi:hypothetical protein